MNITKVKHLEVFNIHNFFPFDSIYLEANNDMESIITIHGFDGNIIAEIKSEDLEFVEDNYGEDVVKVLKEASLIN